MNNDTNDQRISYYESRKGSLFARFVRGITRWAWASQVRAPINRLHERGCINSQVFHEARDYAERIINSTKPMTPRPPKASTYTPDPNGCPHGISAEAQCVKCEMERSWGLRA